jgi:hypothetical protein
MAIRGFLMFILPSIAAAQSTFVSPAGTASVEGNSQNSAPFVAGGPFHYLQIHSDLPGPMVIRQLAFRRDSRYPGAGTRELELELWMGDSVAFDRPSWMISRNYIGPRNRVVARQRMFLGPIASPTTPAPFEIRVPLDVPFPFAGRGASLAWEIAVYAAWSSSSQFPRFLDAEGSSVTTSSSFTTGAGCSVVNQTSGPMTLRIFLADIGGALSLGGSVTWAPRNAPILLALGRSNPSLPVPGLCAPLYTDLMVVMPLGMTDRTGFYGADSSSSGPGGPFAWSMLNPAPGATIYAQAHALDTGSRFLIPLASSDGRQLAIPYPSSGAIARVTRIYNSYGVLVEEANFMGASNLGYGLVTEFTY